MFAALKYLCRSATEGAKIVEVSSYLCVPAVQYLRSHISLFRSLDVYSYVLDAFDHKHLPDSKDVKEAQD